MVRGEGFCVCVFFLECIMWCKMEVDLSRNKMGYKRQGNMTVLKGFIDKAGNSQIKYQKRNAIKNKNIYKLLIKMDTIEKEI